MPAITGSHAEPQVTLLSLPAEIRATIWKYTLGDSASAQAIFERCIDFCNTWDDSFNRSGYDRRQRMEEQVKRIIAAVRADRALMLNLVVISKQICREAKPFVLHSQNFFIHGSECHIVFVARGAKNALFSSKTVRKYKPRMNGEACQARMNLHISCGDNLIQVKFGRVSNREGSAGWDRDEKFDFARQW